MRFTKPGLDLLRRSRRRVFHKRVPVDLGYYVTGKDEDLVILLERPSISGRVLKQVTYLVPPGLQGAEADVYLNLRAGGTGPSEAADLANRLAG